MSKEKHTPTRGDYQVRSQRGMIRLFLSAVTGLLSGALIGGVLSSVIVFAGGSLFHWEMAGLFLIVVATLVAGTVGALIATTCAMLTASRVVKCLTGLGGGLGLGVAFGFLFFTQTSAPGIALYSAVIVVLVSGLAGLTAGLLSIEHANTSID